MNFKKIISLMFVICLLVTSCGQHENPKVDSTQSEENSHSFTIGVLFNPQDTLDPSTVTSPGGVMLLYALYDSLATTERDGVKLRMAEFIDSNEDSTIFTIKLKDNLYFSDETPVTGEDTLLSLKHLAESQMYQSLYGNIDLEKSSAKGNEITLVLKTPASDFLSSSIGMFSPVSKGGDFTGVGAGAYIIGKGDSQSGYVLEANKNYYGGGKLIPEITLLNVPDSSSKVKALQSGEIDYAWGLDSSAIQILSKEEDIELPGGTLDGATAMELVLNTRVPPFNDPDLRKAAKLTVDLEKLVKTILGDYGELGNDALGKGFSTYPDDLEQTKMNKEEAKKIFAKKGIKEFSLVSSDIVPGLNKATEMMVQDFKDVGVSVNVEILDPQTFFSQMDVLYQKSAFTFYWINRSPLDEFRSQILQNSPYNVSGYFSENTENNFQIATSSKDIKVQEDAIEEISKEIHDLGGDLIWGYQMDISARRKGFEAPTTSTIPWLGEAVFTPDNK